MKLLKNIDVVQINIKEGVAEYFIPKNVDWANQVIEKIAVYATNHDTEEYSPIDGVTPILDREALASVYFDIYNADEQEIAHNLNAQNLLYTNNNPVEINSKISLQLSRVFWATTSPVDGCILLYVQYASKEVEDYQEPQKSVTIDFEMKYGSEIKLSDVIDTYIHAIGCKIKGILHWGGLGKGVGTFMTLRNRNFKTIVKHLPLNFCRPPMGEAYFDGGELPAERVQANTLYLDSEDIDFANSTIVNTDPSERSFKVTLTLLY